MTDFPTFYRQRPDRPKSNPGSRLHDVYSPVYDHNGVLDLEVTGQEDIYQQIQSHAESCDINVLIARYNSGDPTALSQRQGMYIDATGMPHTYAEMLNAIITAETTFNSLPVEIRAKFGHSFEQFLAQMDSPEFADKLGITTPLPTDTADGPADVSEERPVKGDVVSK